MGLRKTILATGETYHIFNHSSQGIPLFKGGRECKLILESMKFYLQPNPPIRFSIYRTSKNRFPVDLSHRLVTIICFCLMPNHFHLILRQEKDNGIKQFIQRVSNSFAHYFNVKYKRRGHVFEGSFKAVRVETEEQLNHLSRYIHLNPVTSYLVKDPHDYPHSSYKVYIGEETSDIIDCSFVLNHFSSFEEYKKFVLSQKDYQRTLKSIERLLFE
jgi:putative transposase